VSELAGIEGASPFAFFFIVMLPDLAAIVGLIVMVAKGRQVQSKPSEVIEPSI
jgi:hypothetical protein